MFFLSGPSNFLTPKSKSTIKSSPITGGQIPKNVTLSMSYSHSKSQETIFVDEIPARVKVTPLDIQKKILAAFNLR